MIACLLVALLTWGIVSVLVSWACCYVGVRGERDAEEERA